MAGQRSPEAVAASIEAIRAAAERAGLPVPSQEVEGAVAPPVTPAEQARWLEMAAKALMQTGNLLEAARVLLGFGPDYDGGRCAAAAG